MERTRTVTWDDPNASAQLVGKVSGLEMLRMMIEKRVPAPPMARLLDFSLVEARDGFAAFECQPQEFHYNPIGVVHGGLAMTLLDSALGCAVQTTLPAGQGYTTLDVQVNLVRAITKDTPRLRAEAKILHAGRTVRTSTGEVRDATGKLYAHATSTCMVLDGR